MYAGRVACCLLVSHDGTDINGEQTWTGHCAIVHGTGALLPPPPSTNTRTPFKNKNNDLYRRIKHRQSDSGGQTDRQTPDSYITLSARRSQCNNDRLL